MNKAKIINTDIKVTVSELAEKYDHHKNNLVCPECNEKVIAIYYNQPEKGFFRHQNTNNNLPCPNRTSKTQYYGVTSTPNLEIERSNMKYIEENKSTLYQQVKAIIKYLSYEELNNCITLAKKKGTLGNKTLKKEQIAYVLTTYMRFKKGGGYKNSRTKAYRCYFYNNLLYRQEYSDNSFKKLDKQVYFTLDSLDYKEI